MLEFQLPPKQVKKRPKAKISSFKKKRLLILLILVSSLGLLTLQNLKAKFLGHPNSQQEQTRTSSSLLTLRSQSPSQRTSRLQSIATEEALSIDRSRARYLLATELLQQQQGKSALKYLQGLEQDYPVLRPQILLKTAEAYQQSKQEKAFQATLNYLIQTYPHSPLVADAWFLLSQGDSRYQTKLIEQFPAHPRTQELARKLLSKNPDQFKLLLLLAKYSRESDLNPIRDRLVLEYPAKLEPQDWEAIADGYWRDGENRKAADAYTLAFATPRNLYRAARGFQLNGNIDTAHRAYQNLLGEYHDAREAGLALLELASISSGDEAVVYLERAIAKFPENAPQAYRSKAIIHDAFGKVEAANQARQKLLTEYTDSPAAADYRWQMAQKLAANGNKQDAWQWMQPVLSSNLNLEFAPKALYSTGKWAKDLGKSKSANTAFKRVIELYPQSYWAWRSAILLGWDVGNFNTVGKLKPSLDFTETYTPLPMGSEALQELYFLGQYQDAWTLWQSEIEQHQQLSVNEQFIEGLLLLKLGQVSRGMEEILALAQRESPQEKEQWQSLRHTTSYWYGLFPFPYQENILDNAQKDQVNPLLVISVMRKESTFDPEIDSTVGAKGLMQIVPPTAKWIAEQIKLNEYSLTDPKDNIEIGAWYLAHNHYRYDNNSLLAVASYNAGTGNVNKWLNQYNINEPDGFVEQIPYAETKDYVEGVFGNYWNYLRLYNPKIREQVSRLTNN